MVKLGIRERSFVAVPLEDFVDGTAKVPLDLFHSLENHFLAGSSNNKDAVNRLSVLIEPFVHIIAKYVLGACKLSLVKRYVSDVVVKL